jgi:hypothetical protein
VHIDSFVALCVPKSPRRMPRILVDDTPVAGIVLVKTVHEKVPSASAREEEDQADVLDTQFGAVCGKLIAPAHWSDNSSEA